eukprot:5774693-Amphidinium_carterae.1
METSRATTAPQNYMAICSAYQTTSLTPFDDSPRILALCTGTIHTSYHLCVREISFNTCTV